MGFSEQKTRIVQKLASFWISPLLVGGCLAFGYEITHRILNQTSKLKLEKASLFSEEIAFPGSSLEDLRILYGTKKSLIKRNLAQSSTQPLAQKTTQPSTRPLAQKTTQPSTQPLAQKTTQNFSLFPKLQEKEFQIALDTLPPLLDEIENPNQTISLPIHNNRKNQNSFSVITEP